MQHFSSNGIDIAYVDLGSGPPILLIHGFASNHAVNWQATSWFATLSGADRRIVAMDVRGHGESGKVYDSAQFRPALMADDAANLLDHIQIAKADLIGYSMGGRIAARLAIAHPDKVNALVIGGMGYAMVSGIGGEDEIVAALKAPSLEAVTGDVGRGYRKFAEQTGSDHLALAACILGQREIIPVDDLARIRAPTLVAVGEKDQVAGSAEELARVIPGAEVLIIPRRDHMLATGDKTFKAGVLDFLSRHPLIV